MGLSSLIGVVYGEGDVVGMQRLSVLVLGKVAAKPNQIRFEFLLFLVCIIN